MPPLIQLQPPLLSQNYTNQTQQNQQYLYQSPPMIHHPSNFSFFYPQPPPPPPLPPTPHPSTLILQPPEFSPPPPEFTNLPYPTSPSAHRGKENKAKEQNKQPDKFSNHGKPPWPNMLPMSVKNKPKIVKNPLGRIDGSRMGERIENRLRKPTSFVCKMKFRNELPDLTAQPKILPLKRDPDREGKIKEIEASFEAFKSVPSYATNKNLHPVEVIPLHPDFDRFRNELRNELPDLTAQPKILPLKRDPDRYNDQFVVVTFGSDPTADSEAYKNLNKSVRDAYESKAVMKSCVAKESDSSDDTDNFLAYLAPSPDEMSKDINDEEKVVAFSWVCEYHYNVQSDDDDDPKSYLESFDDSEARAVPLPTKLKLRKKKMSKTTFTKVVVRRRSTAEEPAVQEVE